MAGADRETYEHEEGLFEGGELPAPRTWVERWASCFLAACVLNVAALYITKIVRWGLVRAEEPVEVSMMVAPETPEPPQEKLPREPIEEPIDVQRPPVEEPLFQQVPVLDKTNETDNDMPMLTARGNEEFTQVDVPSLHFLADVAGTGGGAGGAFGHRLGGGRRNRVRAYGGSRRTESAVEAALRWLARHQNPDGSWSADGFHARCGSDPDRAGRCDGDGRGGYDVGVTGLAVEAFLGHGNTHRQGAYRDVVGRAVAWLKGQQGDGGFFGPPPGRGHGHVVYNHALATYAMAEAYAMEPDDVSLRAPVQRAVDWFVAARNPGMAWRYADYPEGATAERDGSGINDTSVTGWVVMALKSASLCKGVTVPRECFDGANAFLDAVMEESDDPRGYRVTFGYTAPGAFVHREPYVTTAAGLLTRQFTGNPRGTAGAAAVLMDRPPSWARCNLYEWYYGIYGLFQQGGEGWRTWNDHMKEALTENQRRASDGCLDGSWDPVGTWGSSGGRVYATAMGALCLEVYYRFVRTDESFGAVPGSRAVDAHESGEDWGIGRPLFRRGGR